MELFQDISNNPQLPGTQQQPVLKTFERRRRVVGVRTKTAAVAQVRHVLQSEPSQGKLACG